MKTTTISRGGQVSVPAAVRRRWGTRELIVEDLGNALVFRPIPPDPIGAAMGSLAGHGPPTEEIRRREREAEAHAEDRKYRR
jgi:hypothetical protein